MTSSRIATLLTAGLIALGAGHEAHGGEPRGRIGFRAYGTDTGLENQDVSWVLQDREGFVWVCALDAVYRFDGARFERFGMMSGLPSMSVKDMTLDAEGRLLLVTEEGVVHWDGGRFVAVPLDGVPSRALSLRLDSGKRMWVGTEQGPYVEAAPGRFLPASGWPGGPARILWVDASGALQVASEGRVLSLDAQRTRWRIRDVTCRARSECPPREKKSSWSPTRSRRRLSFQMAASACSVGVRGATNSCASSGRVPSGTGRALRSTLPLGFRGSASSMTKKAGTM